LAEAGSRSVARATTMADIAHATGVSQSTVSRVLSGRSGGVVIAAETRERILAEARRRNYRPNPLASGLRGAQTRLLGVIVGEITGPFMAGALDALSSEAASLGYNMVVGNARGKADEAVALGNILETRHCDSIILLGATRDRPWLLDDLRSTGIPIVAMGQGIALPDICTVNVDNRAAITTVFHHLADLGHRRIGFIAGHPVGDITVRQATYRDLMSRSRVKNHEELIREVDDDPAGGAAGLESLMGIKDRPTAIICATDTLALGAVHAASALGIRVPEELSITGFDDLFFAAHTIPALTTVRFPIVEMARLAVREAINPEAVSGEREYVIDASFVVRGSTGAAPR
jgi:DNA-binding LacI/PurR family transcriptional regulator